MASELWKEVYRELVGPVAARGYPEQFGRDIARNLGLEKAMRRMTTYLVNAHPRSAEEIADEMLAIMDDRDRWRQKKEVGYYNSRYNDLLNRGL
ncbi:MAG: hypothetical protein MR488_11000 [Lachnospiraceae bacterium]|nr:hypothetical protein [Lachnospiraceae bacterium]